MVSLTVKSDGSFKIQTPVVEIQKQFYRIPWDTERVNYNGDPQRLEYTGGNYGPVRQVVLSTGDPMPAVYRLDPDYHVVLDCACQKLWRELNPNLSNKKWSTLLGNGLAWTNNTGFPGKRNCITGEELSKPFPRFDQMRICAGAIVTGVEKSGFLTIESIRPEKIPPTSEVLAKPWLWYWGTSINPKGGRNIIPRQGIDGKFYGVKVPIITSFLAILPLSQLHKLPLGFIPPSPTWKA